MQLLTSICAGKLNGGCAQKKVLIPIMVGILVLPLTTSKEY